MPAATRIKKVLLAAVAVGAVTGVAAAAVSASTPAGSANVPAGIDRRPWESVVAAGVPGGLRWAIQHCEGRLWVTTSEGGRVVTSGGPLDEQTVSLTVDLAGTDDALEAGLVWRPPRSARRLSVEVDWPAELTASAHADGWWLGVLAGLEAVERLPVAVRALDEHGEVVAVAEGLVENIQIPLTSRTRRWVGRPARGVTTYHPGSRRGPLGRLLHRH
jgi:hypothetical protein